MTRCLVQKTISLPLKTVVCLVKTEHLESKRDMEEDILCSDVIICYVPGSSINHRIKRDFKITVLKMTQVMKRFHIFAVEKNVIIYTTDNIFEVMCVLWVFVCKS